MKAVVYNGPREVQVAQALNRVRIDAESVLLR